MIEAGISDRRIHYKRVIGIDYGSKKEADYFKTWNGEDLVYVFEEDRTLVDVVTGSQLERSRSTIVSDHKVVSPNLAKKKAIKKKREKLAKLSRQKNRKK